MSYLVLFYFVLVLLFSVLLALRLPLLEKRELILVLFVRLFDLNLFGFVCFLFLLVSGKGCRLLWHSLDFSLTFFLKPYPESITITKAFLRHQKRRNEEQRMFKQTSHMTRPTHKHRLYVRPVNINLRIRSVRSQGSNVSSCGQQKESDQPTQADLSSLANMQFCRNYFAPTQILFDSICVSQLYENITHVSSIFAAFDSSSFVMKCRNT